MSVDVFGHTLEQVNSRPGPPGIGFQLTADGQYDLQNKRLCNLSEPQESSDAVNLDILQRSLHSEVRSVYEVTALLRKDLDDAKLELQIFKDQSAEKVKKIDVAIEELQTLTHRGIVEEIHKPARRNYPRRKFNVRGLDETWQADLVEMQPYARVNKGFRYLLTIVDVFSKSAWAVPVKRKFREEVTAAMKSVLHQGRVPTNLQTDRDKEFYNKSFQNLMKFYNINLYSTYSNLKASICERFNRTLKNKMWIQFSLRGNYKWLDILPDLIAKYNDTKHRTIGIKPNEVSNHRAQVLKRFRKKSGVTKKKQKFKVGDKVRVSNAKQVFDKGYTPNWSTEIFTVSHVIPNNPVTYKLKDYRDEPIAGGFYEQELSKTKYPDVYLVEKVLKRRGNQVYVKWLGFDSTHNSWTDKSSV
ncbi:uncharacterized protein LOC116416073 [Nasonia vitripennis]|uniref:Uncharacterized protein n=1 Tax=Nasonia vitripennis TaxID=7425 RepID=A0A7M7PXU7_NASVI|nr:uncharacterized protein LOC116416073 [Nasonia vitripennis]